MTTQATAAPTIAIPKGGGALQGIGEKFSPDLHTGTGNLSIPLVLPPGRNAFQPRLTVSYSTGSGNGPFGLGWSVGVPAVARKTSQGVPRYRDHATDQADQDVFILSGAEDLVPVATLPDGAVRYRPRTEGLFAQIDRHLESGTWQVRSKDGLVSRYGAVQADGDRAVVADPDAPERMFAWKLTETVDSFGNRIRYEYLRDGGNNASHRWDQLYLERVRYVDYEEGGNTRYLVSVEFEYDDRPDPFSDCRAGFEIRTTKRCSRVVVRTHAGEDRLVRTYELVYLDQRPELAQVRPPNGSSLLSQIVVKGHDGSRVEELPPLEFGYTRFEPEGRRFFALEGRDLPVRSLAGGDMELVDLFGGGLPDLLEMSGTTRYWRNLGGGRFDRPLAMAAAPAGVRLGGPGVQLVDANGDGRADLLVTAGNLAGYYPMQFGGAWDARSFQAYPAAPSFDLRDPEVRLVDLDGDGVTDALRAGTQLECYFNDPATGWGETRLVDRGGLDGLRDLTFSDPRVRLADLNGDGMQDIALVHDGRVDYWPSLGRGSWGGRVTMANSPRLPRDYDPRRVLLGDVDGDGAADLIYVDDGEVTLWINQSGHAWSDPIVIRGTPRVTNLDAVRLADVLGAGITGLLWSTEAAPEGDNLYFLDFTGGVKPYLLDATDNHMGALTRVEYAPSTRFYAADLARAETRWKTPLPFPVHVVARTETVDALSGGKLTTEYTYHHGYWDGEEREFRGFGRVDQRDTESFQDFNREGLHGPQPFARVPLESYTPPLETRTWFHQGAVTQEGGDWGESDFGAEFWEEPWPGVAGTSATELQPRATATATLLAALPPRARRAALRVLRGGILRTELYALDGSDLEDRPYTVTEHRSGVREEGPPAPGADSDRIFFPHPLGERVTQWERGGDPMTRFTFTDDYDTVGQPRSHLEVAVPRGRDPRAEGEWAEPYLATHTDTTYAGPAPDGPYIRDRVASVTTRELVGVRAGSVLALHDAVLSGKETAAGTLIGQTLSFYDGPAFEGLPLGEVGAAGAPVRSESLVLTPQVVAEAYGADVPPYFADAPDWSGYPEAFRALTAPAAGYVRHTAADGSPAVTGFYAVTARRAYDFQRPGERPLGLVRLFRDPLGRETTVAYDAPFGLLPVEVTDPAGLRTRAAYDYRLLQPREVTDVNGNRTAFEYSALGLVASVVAMGKVGERVGDTQEQPGTRFDYDFFAFERTQPEQAQPVFVHAVRRTEHRWQIVADENARRAAAGGPQLSEQDIAVMFPADEVDRHPERFIQSREYTDGFGRLLQSRTQAEDVVFGTEPFGAGVLPADPKDAAGTRADVVGRRSAGAPPRVVVSGWQVYDNKGRVAEQYEPFFAEGWDVAPAEDAQRGRKLRQFYDPRGEMVRTVGPDGAEQRVLRGVPADLADPGHFVPTPWEAFTYDANDNAGRTHPEASAAYAHHWNTPASAVLNGLGHTVLTVARSRDPGPAAPVEEHRTRTEYDVRGNVLAVIDPLGRTAARSGYDLAGNPLRSASIDAGVSVAVLDALGRGVERRDAKGARILSTYDALGRPTHLWACDHGVDALTLRERIEYGDAGVPAQDSAARLGAAAANQLGRPVRHYDEAGLLTLDAYDLHGNVIERSRRIIRDEHLLRTFTEAATNHWRLKPFHVDWTAPDAHGLEEHAATLLDPAVDVTSLRYDALGRLGVLRLPSDAAGKRREVRQRYNRAGLLEQVRTDDATWVEHAAYDAKGQRTLVVLGNGVMTRCAYDADTFRLVRTRSERCARLSDADLTYRPAPASGEGHPLQDLAYSYDIDGNVLTLVERTPGCGVRDNPEALAVQQGDPDLAVLLGSGDALVRRFNYDPLGRLRSATGRECTDAAIPRPWDDARGCGFGSGRHGTADQDNAPMLTTLFRQRYMYDPAGNMVSLHHEAKGTWTRHFGAGGRAAAAWEAEWAGHTEALPWPDAPGNQLTHVGDDDPAAPQTHFYDACGNLERQHLDRHLSWDHANRLALYRRQVAASGSAPADERWAEPSVCSHYLYDSTGQRVKKLVRLQGGALEVTVYAGGNMERRTWTLPGGGTGLCTLLHVSDDRRRIATLRIGDRHPDDQGPAMQYHFGDHLDSGVLTVDAEGHWLNREEYTPYGETAFGGFARKRYRFTGKQRDTESGLYYHGARYYAPWLARWISCDPLQDPVTWNLYAYAADSPIRLVDPDGADEREADAYLQALYESKPFIKEQASLRAKQYGPPELRRPDAFQILTTRGTPQREQVMRSQETVKDAQFTTMLSLSIFAGLAAVELLPFLAKPLGALGLIETGRSTTEAVIGEDLLTGEQLTTRGRIERGIVGFIGIATIGVAAGNRKGAAPVHGSGSATQSQVGGFVREFPIRAKLAVEARWVGKGGGSNSLGYKRGVLFQVLRQKFPDLFPPGSKNPKVTPELGQAFPEFEPYVGEPLVEHHLAHGGTAYPLPKSLHSPKSTTFRYLHGATRNVGKMADSVMNAVPRQPGDGM